MMITTFLPNIRKIYKLLPINMRLLTFFLCLVTCVSAWCQSIEYTIDSVCKAHRIAPFTTRLIIAHAKVESGNFTNNLVLKHNNVFGMKHARVRPTLSLGPLARAEGKKGYAAFRSIAESTVDYLMWVDYHREIRVYRTTIEYVTMLDRHGFYGCSRQEYFLAIKSYL